MPSDTDVPDDVALVVDRDRFDVDAAAVVELCCLAVLPDERLQAWASGMQDLRDHHIAVVHRDRLNPRVRLAR